MHAKSNAAPQPVSISQFTVYSTQTADTMFYTVQNSSNVALMFRLSLSALRDFTSWKKYSMFEWEELPNEGFEMCSSGCEG